MRTLRHRDRSQDTNLINSVCRLYVQNELPGAPLKATSRNGNFSDQVHSFFSGRKIFGWRGVMALNLPIFSPPADLIIKWRKIGLRDAHELFVNSKCWTFERCSHIKLSVAARQQAGSPYWLSELICRIREFQSLLKSFFESSASLYGMVHFTANSY